MAEFRSVRDVAQWRLCLGCGACAYSCPERLIKLVDVLDEGIRPILRRTECGSCTACLDVCPAYETDHSTLHSRPGVIREMLPTVGPVLEIWEGHATDPEIRFAGSSGGVLTALALYCVEKRAMHGVLHIGFDPDNPVRNVTRLSRTRQELLEKTGSRYAPASACDRLDLVENAPAPCVFIGQPSEVTALRKAQRLRPALDNNLGVCLSFFCAGSPSTRGTLELLKKLGVDPGGAGALRYRGNGWPGNFTVTLKGNASPAPSPLLRAGKTLASGRGGGRPDPGAQSATHGPCVRSPIVEGLPTPSEARQVGDRSVGRANTQANPTPSHLNHSPSSVQLTYKESWGFLQAYRPYSTHLCPDGTGEDADISCGDPWYREMHDGESGSSLVVVRTERGREVVRDAMAAGYVKLTPATPEKLLDSQRNLINKRAAIWGRLLAFKLFGLPRPRLRGFSLFKLWLGLPLNEKFRSTLGTARRIVTREYYRPLQIQRQSATDLGCEE